MNLISLYRHRFSTDEAEELGGVWQVLVEHWFPRWIKPTDAVLDVGAGLCLFINRVKARRRVALDANPEVARHCAPGVEFVQTDDVVRAPLQGKFDAVLASNFLEHLDSSHDVIEVLAGLRRWLAPGGRLIILQPNFLLIGPRYFDFIDHKTVLTDRSLAEALTLAGYRITFMRRRFLPYTSKSRLPRARWLVRLYLMCPPAQFLLGRQTFVVAEPDETAGGAPKTVMEAVRELAE